MGENQVRTSSVFEAAVFVLSMGISLPVLDGYFLDLFGVAFTLPILIALLVLEAAVIGTLLYRGGRRLGRTEAPRLFVGVLAFVVVLGPSLFLISPSFLPISGSIDAVHHYQLVDYIYTHLRLAHGPLADKVLGGMAVYPFGACFIAALVAQVLGMPPIYVMTPVCAFLAACTAVFAYASVSELIDSRRSRVLALLVAPLLIWPVPYTFGQFTRDFFLTQILGITCVIGLGYWLTFYARSGDRIAFVPMVGLGTTLIFSYPTLMPVFAGSFVLAPILTRSCPSLRVWARDCLIVGLPLLALSGLYLHDRIAAGIAIIENDGATISPGLDTLPLSFVTLSLVGVGVATWHPKFRIVATLFWLTALQTLAFYGAVTLFHQLSPYAVKKMFFLLVPEMAIVATMAVVYAFSQVEFRGRLGTVVRAVAGFVIAGAIGFGIGEEWILTFSAFDPRPSMGPLVTTDQLAVATWAEAHLPEGPVTLIADDSRTVNWIQIGLLHRPPTTVIRGNDPIRKGDQFCAFGGLSDYVLVTEDVDAWAAGGAQTLFRQGDVGLFRGWGARKVERFGHLALLSTGGTASNLSLDCVFLDAQPEAPGGLAPVAVMLNATAPIDRHYIVEARLRGRDSNISSQVDVPVTPYDKPVIVMEGQLLAIPLMLPIPPTLRPGAYDVEIVFFDDRWGTLQIAMTDSVRQRSVVVGPLTVASDAELPLAGTQPGTLVDGRLGGVLDLVGYGPPTVADGVLSLDVLWRAIQPISTDYTLFFHLLDDQGKVVAQADSFPWGGLYPTSSWTPGRLVRDHVRLALPTPLPAGSYRLIAGAYRLETMQRLAVAGPDGQPRGDFVSLTTLTLPK